MSEQQGAESSTTGQPSAGPVSAGSAPARAWHAELAWLPGVGVRPDVLIESVGDRFSKVSPCVGASDVPAGATRLTGLTMPGLANGHSHAFHRALRGITQAGTGSFWTWRERMYQVADRLDPDSYLALARAAYAEMALAGISCVGEFHYLHHGPGGSRYSDPNVMGRALIEAATQAGLRITLLDTCYLCGGLDSDGGEIPLAGPQLRFGDGTAQAWAKRVDLLGADTHGMVGPAARVGAAIHSVRAVPPAQMHPVIAWSHRVGAPLHVHLSEQVAENEACLAAYRCTPAAVLYDAGALGPRTTVVHATHLSPADIRLLGGSEVFACVCPTTEADLADGIGPFGALVAAGCRLTVGSDSQAVVDLLEEARRIEMYERLASHERGHFTAEALGRAMTWDGHASLGWPEAGEIAPGSLADLVTIGFDSPRLAGLTQSGGQRPAGGGPGLGTAPGSGSGPAGGGGPASGSESGSGPAGGGGPALESGSGPAGGGGLESGSGSGPAGGGGPPSAASPGRAEPDLGALEAVVFAASPADVHNVVIGGRDVVAGGRHLLVPDVAAELAAAVRTALD